MPRSYVLYGTDHSYYTGKVRPYLQYKGIPYEEKLATLWVFSRFIIPRTGVRYIPVLQTPQDEVVQDTTDIIDFLERQFPERSVYPDAPKQNLVALLMELYADEWFTLPAMHYRWSYLNQQEDYVMEEFGNVAAPFLPGPLKRMVGRKISKPFKGALKPLGISANTASAIEDRYIEFVKLFNAHLSEYPYLLGSRPSIGDFALAGPLYAHMWKDPVPRPILVKHGPKIVEWIERINAKDQAEGQFLPEDAVPDTLLPLLEHLFLELWPVLADTANKLEVWLKQNPQKKHISRAIGWHTLTIGNAAEQRLIFPYSQWMMQRPLDHYNSLNAADRQQVDELLRACGGFDAMQLKIPRRVKRVNNRLVAE